MAMALGRKQWLLVSRPALPAVYTPNTIHSQYTVLHSVYATPAPLLGVYTLNICVLTVAMALCRQ